MVVQDRRGDAPATLLYFRKSSCRQTYVWFMRQSSATFNGDASMEVTSKHMLFCNRIEVTPLEATHIKSRWNQLCVFVSLDLSSHGCAMEHHEMEISAPFGHVPTHLSLAKRTKMMWWWRGSLYRVMVPALHTHVYLWNILPEKKKTNKLFADILRCRSISYRSIELLNYWAIDLSSYWAINLLSY